MHFSSTDKKGQKKKGKCFCDSAQVNTILKSSVKNALIRINKKNANNNELWIIKERAKLFTHFSINNIPRNLCVNEEPGENMAKPLNVN